MTNIAFWLPNSLKYMGGGVKWTLQASALLQRRGHHVEIFAPPFSVQKSSNNTETKDLTDVIYHETWSPKLESFDVVYIMYNPLWRLCKMNRTKSMAGIHSPLWYSRMAELAFCVKPSNSLTFFTGKSFYLIFGKADLRYFKKIHIINPIAKVNHNNVAFVPNWIDTHFWKSAKPKEPKFSALFVGRRNLEKGWDIYVKTAELLKNLNPDIKFYATGANYGAIYGVDFPTEEDMPQLYSRFHILVVPARLNVFPLTFLESLSCGTPVATLPIATHVSLSRLGMPLLFANSYVTISELVRNIYEIWTAQPEQYTAMCAAARQAALKFDVEEVFPRFEKMLIEI
jgi:glycosyltransferase involved in cell wall biosynthesis